MNDQLLASKPVVKKEVDEIMSSQTISYPSKEIYNEGHSVGLQEGHKAGLQEGLSIGAEKGRTNEVFESVRDGDYGPERGAQKLGLSLADFKKRMTEAGFLLPAVG